MINGQLTYPMMKKSENTLNKKGFPLDIRPEICYNYYIMMSHVMLTLKCTINNLIMKENILCVLIYAVEIVVLSALSCLPKTEKKFVNWGNKCHFPLTLTSGICYN
jgi:hypothetical protein